MSLRLPASPAGDCGASRRTGTESPGSGTKPRAVAKGEKGKSVPTRTARRTVVSKGKLGHCKRVVAFDHERRASASPEIPRTNRCGIRLLSHGRP